MTIHELFEKLDREYDRQGEYGFDPVPIAEQAIRESIERAKPTEQFKHPSPNREYRANHDYSRADMDEAYDTGVEDFYTTLLKELGLSEQEANGK
jgi:hypothetical protein